MGWVCWSAGDRTGLRKVGVSRRLRRPRRKGHGGRLREAREEAGLDVRLEGLVNIYSYPGRAPVIIVYAATAVRRARGRRGMARGAEFDLDDIPWDVLRSAARARDCATTSTVR